MGVFLGGGNYWGDRDWQRITGLWSGLTLRPVSAASISLEPNWSRWRRALPYVSTVDSDAGDRYLFGALDQTTFAVTVRLSYSETPDLSIP